jgi:hypothetical protein
MMRPSLLAAVFLLGGALSSCSTNSRPTASLEVGALPVMERVAINANRCWFKSKDQAFAAYRLAPELNSFSGTPRILIVKKHAPEALPLLVVQASGTPAKMSAFGPLMNEPGMSARVNKDVTHWARGGQGC